MSFKFVTLGLAALSLSACATYQENPNYKYSSKYEGEEAVTQLATNTTTTQPPNTTQAQSQTVVYSDAAPVYSDVIIASTPVEASPYAEEVTIINPAAIVPSPTDQAYAGQEVIGTPGYGLYAPEAGQSSAPTSGSSGAQVVDYDYSENFVSVGVDVDSTNDVIRVPSVQKLSTPVTGANYTVRDGDTVYSMARRLCVGLDEIAGPNNLGSSFAINIGQSLILPSSRC